MSEIPLRQVDFVPSPTGYEVETGEPTALRGLQASPVEYHELASRMDEANTSYSMVRGPSGKRYERIIFNAHKLAEAQVYKSATSFSSGYKNPANVLETALQATMNPDAAYIYLGALGNRPSRHMKLRELGYIALRGRYTKGSGTDADPYRPLPTVADWAVAAQSGLPKPERTYFIADAEGGRAALGLMSAFAANSVHGVLLNGVDGISHTRNYAGVKLLEDAKSRIYRRRKAPEQPGELTPVNIKDLKRRMPNVYRRFGRIAHNAPLPLVFVRDVFDKLLVTAGFMRNDRLQRLGRHAVFHDMRAALMQQDATATLIFNSDSAIHEEEPCIEFGKTVMNSLPEDMRTATRRVRLLLGQGTLDHNTDRPHDYARIIGQTFPDIMRQMTARAGGLATHSAVFGLAPLQRSAA